jgi:hypothetical protein
MNIVQWYAAAITCIAVCCLLIKIFSQLAEVAVQMSQRIAKQVRYRYIINRHALIGPWSLAFALAQIAFFGVNVFCVCFKASDMSQMGDRAGSLAVINLSPLVMGFQFHWVAHALGYSLALSCEIHRSLGLNAFVLAAIHVVIATAKDTSLLSSLPQHPTLIIVSHAIGSNYS